MKRQVFDGIPLVWHHLIEDRPPDGFGLFVPEDPDKLLEAFDDDEFEASDERMPYFATLWPSAVALSLEVMAGPSLEGRRVLDVGCGLGAVGLAAARRGGRVCLLDWEPRALGIARQSAAALGLEPETYVEADWRDPPALGRFDRILGADVLYEERNIPGIVQFLLGHLRPGGEAWIADPQRRYAEYFPESARFHGLEVDEPQVLSKVEGTQIVVHRVHLRGAAADL